MTFKRRNVDHVFHLFEDRIEIIGKNGIPSRCSHNFATIGIIDLSRFAGHQFNSPFIGSVTIHVVDIRKFALPQIKSVFVYRLHGITNINIGLVYTHHIHQIPQKG